MKYVKKFEAFISEKNVASPEPVVKPANPDVKPGTREKPSEEPQRPNPIKRERTSPIPAPAKAMKKATAEDVAERFIELIAKSGDDIKKYAEIK